MQYPATENKQFANGVILTPDMMNAIAYEIINFITALGIAIDGTTTENATQLLNAMKKYCGNFATTSDLSKLSGSSASKDDLNTAVTNLTKLINACLTLSAFNTAIKLQADNTTSLLTWLQAWTEYNNGASNKFPVMPPKQ